MVESESVNEGIFDYDEIFEELYAKYGGGDSEIAPELKDYYLPLEDMHLCFTYKIPCLSLSTGYG